uniref:Uncharacterized protein n=1 Tax=Mycena chlorophos TaxID=658473 RepID=A0ABQ0LH69_MYCCL|nr:predicted protein [Mycena chlorophos]
MLLDLCVYHLETSTPSASPLDDPLCETSQSISPSSSYESLLGLLTRFTLQARTTGRLLVWRLRNPHRWSFADVVRCRVPLASLFRAAKRGIAAPSMVAGWYGGIVPVRLRRANPRRGAVTLPHCGHATDSSKSPTLSVDVGRLYEDRTMHGCFRGPRRLGAEPLDGSPTPSLCELVGAVGAGRALRRESLPSAFEPRARR